jgi:hypothetical protein
MTIAAKLTVDNPAPQSGSTVIATYTVTGLSPIVGLLKGNVKINGVDTPVTATLGDQVSFDLPTIAGLTFQPTTSPNVFKAIVP